MTGTDNVMVDSYARIDSKHMRTACDMTYKSSDISRNVWRFPYGSLTVDASYFKLVRVNTALQWLLEVQCLG